MRPASRLTPLGVLRGVVAAVFVLALGGAVAVAGILLFLT